MSRGRFGVPLISGEVDSMPVPASPAELSFASPGQEERQAGPAGGLPLAQSKLEPRNIPRRRCARPCLLVLLSPDGREQPMAAAIVW